MGLLEDKIIELAATDSLVEVALKDAGAIDPADAVGDIGKPIGDELTVALDVDLAAVDATLIARAKAEIHAALDIPEPFVHEGHTITVTALSLDGEVLVVDLEADCPTSGPYRFTNPPLQVVTKDAVVTTDEEGNPYEVSPRETIEDPAAALKVIVGEAVHGYAVSQGWTR